MCSPVRSGKIPFLSTPSARRATSLHASPSSSMSYFYPRPPRGGRPAPSPMMRSSKPFLSTPSARRATFPFERHHRVFAEFLSTPSARRATRKSPRPRTGSPNFYPRPPRGGRPRLPRRSCRLFLFLSTPSARRATAVEMLLAQRLCISIHALREEGDHLCWQSTDLP